MTHGDTKSLAHFENNLGYSFKEQALLERALTHSSIAYHRNLSNERLEFLGDRVLGLVVADMLLEEFPDEDEGALGYRFAALARRETLECVAENIGFSSFVKQDLNLNEMSARQKSGVLANACEAVIGAIYLDGGMIPAHKFVRNHWLGYLKQDITPPKDSKTRLQEFAQAQGWVLPKYNVIDQSGPDHAPEFTVEVCVEHTPPAHGKGKSKREAEIVAATSLILLLNRKPRNGCV
jgi:ribonuclease-3